MAQRQARNRLSQSLAHDLQTLPSHAWQEDHELFPTPARQAARTQTAWVLQTQAIQLGLQGLGHQSQTLVSCRMPVAIVVGLEMVDVHQQDRQAAWLQQPLPPFGTHQLIKVPAVGHPGQGVLPGQRIQALLRLHQL